MSTQFIRKSRQMHEFPLADTLLDWLKQAPNLEEPIFPELYSESEFTLNGKLKHPRVHMQGILKSHGRPHATLIYTSRNLELERRYVDQILEGV